MLAILGNVYNHTYGFARLDSDLHLTHRMALYVLCAAQNPARRNLEESHNSFQLNSGYIGLGSFLLYGRVALSSCSYGGCTRDDWDIPIGASLVQQIGYLPIAASHSGLNLLGTLCHKWASNFQSQSVCVELGGAALA